MSAQEPLSGAKLELSDKMKELDHLLLKTQVENYKKTTAIFEEQLRVLKTENAELQEYIKNIEKRDRERLAYFIPKRQKMPTAPKVSETDSAIPTISSVVCALCKQTMQKKKDFGSKSYAILDDPVLDKQKSHF